MRKNIEILINYMNFYKRENCCIKEYKSDVVRRKFPSKKHSISIEKKEFDKFLKFLDKESKE